MISGQSVLLVQDCSRSCCYMSVFAFQDLDFNDVICLEVPADDEGQSEAKTYSYQDLVDLQSRLMLVVGHEDECKKNVDQFISVSLLSFPCSARFAEVICVEWSG